MHDVWKTAAVNVSGTCYVGGIMEKLKSSNITGNFQAMIGGKCTGISIVKD